MTAIVGFVDRKSRNKNRSGDEEVIEPEGGVPLAKGKPAGEVTPDVAPDVTGAIPVSTALGLSPTRAFLAAHHAAPPAGRGPPAGVGRHPVRVHVSGGEIHFHNDIAGIKAAVPIAEWWSAWQRLLRLEKFVYLDLKNSTVLAVILWIDDDGAGGDMAVPTITVAPCKFSRGFGQLQRTTGG